MKTLTPFHIAFAGLSVLIGLAVVSPPRFSRPHSGTGTFHHYQFASDSATQTKSQPLATVNIAPESPQPAPTPACCVQHGSAELIGEAGSMYEARELLITELSAHELPPLDQGMVNVTDEAQGFRMLPDGMVFSKDISIVLPYDTALIPQGFTPDDILTYYYDKVQQRWIPIERDSVSVGNQTVHSKVNHFTDFINAIIKTPEMPETAAFTPTSIKELKAADPLDGLQLIQPPTANNNGTANLNYQLEIPAGRQGMQPNLALTYNSGGGNGWLGVGWDLSVPSITVETRWGVPRYDVAQESEVYLYSGEQLVTKNAGGSICKMPHRTNQAGQTQRLPDGWQFYTRAGEAHDSIVRHGTAPTNYWWEVTDRYGTTSYYGAYPPGDTQHEPVCIGSGNGIARWALAAIVDASGNMVKYHYSTESNGGAGGTMGKQLYLDSINYTGYYSRIDSSYTPGAYTVVFNRNDSREDVVTSARYGFKEVTASKLCNVQVAFRNELIRTFFFVTDCSRKSNYKTRLEHLIRVDDEGTLDEILLIGGTILPCIDSSMYENIVQKTPIIHYDFEYYDYPSADSIFSEPVPQNLIGDGVSSLFLSSSYGGTALGATKGKSWGVGGTVTLGFGPDIMTTYASGGGNFGYNRSKNNGLLTLIDIDGDGLADKVYKQGNRVYYRPQVRVSETQFRFGNPVLLDGISDFLLETSNDIDFGLQLSVVVVSASGGVPTSKATTTNYFADINADGRPDLVTKEGVYFNCMNPDGTVRFASASDLAAAPEPGDEPYTAFVISDSVCDTFFWDGEIDPTIECGETTICDSTIYHHLPDCTIPVGWGTIIRAAGDTSFQISSCNYYHIGHEDCLYRYCPDKGWDTLKLCAWTPWIDTFAFYNNYDSVQIGDCIYSRVGDKVLERRLRNVHSCGSGDIGSNGRRRDPDIDAVRVWIAPMDGTVKVSSRIKILPDSSESRQQARYVDGVAYSVQHSHGIVWDTSFFIGLLLPMHYNACLTSAYDRNVIAGEISADDTTYHIDTALINVSKGDMLFFDLNSKDNHSFDKVDWKQQIDYQGVGYFQDQYGKDKRHYDSAEDFLLTGSSYFKAPKSGDVCISGTIFADTLTRPARVHITKIPPASSFSETVFTIPANTDFSRSLEGNESLHWHVDSGTVILFFAEPAAQGVRPNWSDLKFSPTLRFSATFNGVRDTLEYHLPLHYDIDSSQIHTLQPNWLSSNPIWSKMAYPLYYNLFGTLYRGWGQFGYNNNTFRFPTHSIRLDRLILPKSMMRRSDDSTSDDIFSNADFDYDDIDTSRLTDEGYMDGLFENLGLYNPLSDSTSWVQVSPYPEYGAYLSYGDVAYFSRNTMTNTRMIDLNFRDADENEDDWEIPEYESVVPVSTDGFPVRTIRKQNVSVSATGSFGANIPCGESDNSSLSLSASETIGHNRITADCMDLNGDGFPDYITDKKVQYTMPWGGLEETAHAMTNEICYTGTESHGGNFGGSCLLPKRGLGGNPKNQPVTYEGSGSVGGDLGAGASQTGCTYVDINGDGLPDRVANNGSVNLNLGYGFSSSENWTFTDIRRGSNTTTGANVSVGYPVSSENAPCAENFDFAQASISGGVCMTHGFNSANNALVDVNGDGLPDQVSVIDASSSIVSYNIGNGQFSYPERLPVGIGKGASFSESINLGVTAGFTFLGMWKLNFGVQGVPQSRSFNRDHIQLVDINGDGYADMVSSDSESEMTVNYNLAGKTNLLRKVTNFSGAYTQMDYALSLPCYEQPQRQWNLLAVVTGEMASDVPTSHLTTLDSIEYRNHHYDRYERLSFGYDTVIVRQYNTEDNNSLYRYTIQGFNNRSFFKRGWKSSESICDAEDNMWIEKLYHATLMDWENPTDSVGEGNCIDLAFTSYEAEITRYYEGLPSPQVATAVRREYDNKRNVIRYTNFGDTARTDEHFVADISYRHGMAHNLISLPDSIIVKDKQGNVLQKRAADYNSLGRVVEIRNYISDTSSAVINLTYDDYGNMLTSLMPANDHGQRIQSDYAYDTAVHTYPVRIHNSFGYVSTAEYDLRFGKPTSIFDLNGNEVRYHYDTWGRLDTLLGPNEIASDKPYTIAMSYQPFLSSGCNPAYVSFAITKHYDSQHPHDPIETVVFADGWGRAVQTKKDAEVDGVNTRTVSGRIQRDCFGRTVAQYHPFADTQDTTTFDPFFDANTLTSTAYDILDRPLKTVLPTGDSTLNAYGFGTYGGKTYFSTTATDPNGISVTTLTGTRKQQIRTIAPMGANTGFVYSPLGLLLSSTDPDNHTTSYTYDLLGRTLSRTHPDACTDTYAYDAAGNLTTHSTQVLSRTNQSINYHYTYNRLDSIIYPLNPSNNVRYTYGDSTATNNRKGKITLVEDASGFKAFSYGKMGEVTEEIRTFVLPNEQYPYTFKMRFSYDSWNRVQTITYPDGEVVYYYYNCGGMLRKVQGRRLDPGQQDSMVQIEPPIVWPGEIGHKSATLYHYNYIDSIRYNAFEQKIFQKNGNGTRSLYTYDILQRLQTLQLYSGQNTSLQNISYTYDKAGNITQITNVASAITTLGGPYTYTYAYDSLYRLASSAGQATAVLSLTQPSYTLNMQYYADGRIMQKTASGRICNNNTTSSFSKSYTYTYNADKPHTVSNIGSTSFSWDANGNMTRQGGVSLAWDEENRLVSVQSGDVLKEKNPTLTVAYYRYSADGERFYKNTGSRNHMVVNGQTRYMSIYSTPTLYASPYLVATSQGYTKHYFVETERIVSKIGDGRISSIASHVVDTAQLQRKQAEVDAAAPDSIVGGKFPFLRTLTDHQTDHPCLYWQHSDHLGSTSWVTDTNGRAVQHLQYMPWGEDFVSQELSPPSYSARYTFSGKEKDSETGLSYFGSRYYSSDLSIWLSVDPMSDKYPSLSPYAYCAGNPVKLVDPNGEDIWILGEDGNKYKFLNGGLFNENGEAYTPKEGSFAGKAVSALNNLKSTKMGNKLVSAFEGENNPDVTIKAGSRSFATPDGTTITWNVEGHWLFTTEGEKRNATTDLGHEFSHAYDKLAHLEYNRYDEKGFERQHDGLPLNEWMACYRENLIRNELGEPLRTHYNWRYGDDNPFCKVPGIKKELPPYLLDVNKQPYFPSQYLK